MAKKRTSQSYWGLVQAKDGTVYVEQSVDGTPVKRWEYDKLGPAAVSVLSSIFLAYDYGYDLSFQFLKEKDGQKMLIPQRKLIIRPDEDGQSLLSRKTAGEVAYFDENEDIEGMPDLDGSQDDDMMDYLESYLLEKDL